MEEKRLATWGTDVPDDLVLDEKLLADALKKVISIYQSYNLLLNTLVIFSVIIFHILPQLIFVSSNNFVVLNY